MPIHIRRCVPFFLRARAGRPTVPAGQCAQEPAFGVYPLRPEFAESVYMVYRATKDPYYLALGQRILDDLDVRRAPGFFFFFFCACG